VWARILNAVPIMGNRCRIRRAIKRSCRPGMIVSAVGRPARRAT
jgi:hypothetical protein